MRQKPSSRRHQPDLWKPWLWIEMNQVWLLSLLFYVSLSLSLFSLSIFIYIYLSYKFIYFISIYLSINQNISVSEFVFICIVVNLLSIYSTFSWEGSLGSKLLGESLRSVNFSPRLKTHICICAYVGGIWGRGCSFSPPFTYWRLNSLNSASDSFHSIICIQAEFLGLYRLLCRSARPFWRLALWVPTTTATQNNCKDADKNHFLSINLPKKKIVHVN